MNPDRHHLRSLAHAMLDGTLDESGSELLSDALATDPALAREVAELALLHDALSREHGAAIIGRNTARRLAAWSIVRRACAAAAVLAVAGVLLWTGLRTSPTASASDVVARLVARAREGDRTYTLRAVTVDDAGGGRRRRDAAPVAADADSAVGRGKQPSIDGAILTVRDPDRYVLVRTDSEGRRVISGCDGNRAWTVREDGTVRTSKDLRRFSGAVPGSKFDLPFLNPGDALAELGASYDIAIVPAAPAMGQPWPRIVGTRRVDARGGPRDIEIAYDASSLVIRSMRLGNLPQARGGPRAVDFELRDESSQPDSFYGHAAHHTADRPIIEE